MSDGRIRPSLMAGMTDYMGASVRQIHQHVGEWQEMSTDVARRLRTHANRIDSEADRFHMPNDMKSSIESWIDDLERFQKNLRRLSGELLVGVEQRHCRLLRNTYDRSKLMDRSCVAFNNAHINTALKDESLRDFIDTIYSDARSIPISYRDMSNALSELETHVGTQPKWTPPREALFVVESESFSEQGTAFSVGKSNFITCSHCLRDDTQIFSVSDVTTRVPIQVLKNAKFADIALITADLSLTPGVFPGASSSIETGDEVLVVGFPSYAPGASVQVYPATATGTKMLHGVELVILDSGILVGMSGGPVFGKDGTFVGVAIRGGTSPDDLGRNEFCALLPATDVMRFLEL